MESPVRIENRAQLIYLLTEAAELEHGIMCCYLFAAFSIKKDTSEGITEEHLSIARRWRGGILQIAIQEMVHMSLACNLLTAVGGSPHIRRPNLPSNPKAYPPSFRLQLAPFNRETLASFAFIESPANQDTGVPGQSSSSQTTHSLGRFTDIFSSERQYQTVGHLYRGIEDGFTYLAQKYGDEQLFLGPPEAQIKPSFFILPGLIPVTDLASAVAAIDGIVEQGEGARSESTDSHYGRFKAMLEEYDQILLEDPEFKPGRPVIWNPYSIMPGDVTDISEANLIDDPVSTDISNLFDGCYEVLMQMLGRLLLHAEESEEQLRKLSDITVALMLDVITPLGEALTTLPAGASHPGLTAGPSFRFPRDFNTLPHRTAAWGLLAERLKELSAYCGILQIQDGVPPALIQVKNSLAQFAERISDP